MTTRGGGRWPRRMLRAAALVLAVVGFAYAYQADLRPDTLEDDTPEARQEGTQRLEAMAAAHGADAWERHRVMDVTFEDVWHGAMMKRAMMHWERSPQALRGRFVRGTWTGELELLSGPETGTRWGIQSWKTWTAEPGEEPVFEHDATVEFVVPTTQYFLELPLRISSATVALEAGDAEWNGKRYDLVLATWERPEPSADVDQYVLFIDPDSGLLARTDFTVRDQGGSAVGSAHYLDYEEFDGVRLPREIAIFGLLPGGIELPVHTFIVKDVQWDTTTVDALRPDPTLESEGESKPGS